MIHHAITQMNTRSIYKHARKKEYIFDCLPARTEKRAGIRQQKFHSQMHANSVSRLVGTLVCLIPTLLTTH